MPGVRVTVTGLTRVTTEKKPSFRGLFDLGLESSSSGFTASCQADQADESRGE
jgi:hypothetical protein